MSPQNLRATESTGPPRPDRAKGPASQTTDRETVIKGGGREALATSTVEVEESGLNAYAAGSMADFDRLYRQSFARIVRTVVGIVGSQAAAEDCAQETFARALRVWARWQPDVSAEAWLHRIAINTAISFRRREQIRALPSLLRRLGPPSAGADPAERVQSRSIVAQLRRLPPKQSAAVVLRYYHGYTNREIAAALGVSERTIGQRIADGLAVLRERVDLGEARELG
jgi:RNA polymerase sigma-70 factor, ECF subfamily